MSVRALGTDDLDAVIELLQRHPVDNVFVASRIRSCGLDPYLLGCEIWGYERYGRLLSMCHAGSNLVPVDADGAALAAFAERIGGFRGCSSIMGPATQVLPLWEELSRRYGSSWGNVRERRPRQPLMATRHVVDDLPSDPRVRAMRPADFEPYFAAAVQMYIEEVGNSPVPPGSRGYEHYVRRLIDTGHAFGIVEDGRVLFKADVGAATRTIAQVQGVWLDPDLRGRGLSGPAMAAVTRLILQRYSSVSLYVNDYNLAARALYRRVGFVEVGMFATILY